MADTNYTNLFNIDIRNIRYDGANIKLIKFGGTIIYEKLSLYVPYEFRGNGNITRVRTIVNDSHPDLSYMFYNCKKLLSANTKEWDTSNVTIMDRMFYECNSLTELDLSDWDVSNVVTRVSDTGSHFQGFYEMFYGCNSLKYLNLSNWDTKNVIYMEHLFEYCESLEVVDLRNWELPNLYTISNSFYWCKSLHTLRLDNWSNDAIRKVIEQGGLYTGSIPSGINKTVRTIYCKEENAVGLESILPDGWVFNYNIDEESDIPEIPEINESLYRPGQYENTGVTEVGIMVNETHTDLSYMFWGCSKLVTVHTEGWDTSNVTNMSHMFRGCTSLLEIDLNNLNVDKVTNMNNMFAGCASFTSLGTENWCNWNTSKVTNMNNMFNGCTLLTSLDISNWDTAKVIDMSKMFLGCKSLTQLDISNLNTSSVTNMSSMFQQCYDLQILNLSNFDMTNVTNTNGMFYYSDKLQELHLDNCSADTISKIVNSNGFPTGTVNGETRKIYYKEADITNITKPDGWEFIYISE